MTQSDLKMHADIHRRALERHKASETANPLVIQVLTMLEEEYRTAHEIMPVDPEPAQ